jgi:hypothetical protein
MLATLPAQAGVKETVGRCLRALGRPRPVLRCPWTPKPGEFDRASAGDMPEDEVALYGDEVDIHLNPKIGPDWMLPGQQKVVVTPGQNVKRYLAGRAGHAQRPIVVGGGPAQAQRAVHRPRAARGAAQPERPSAST